MTHNEKVALMQYLESRLFDFCANVEHHQYNNTISFIYGEMYKLMEDIESSIDANIELDVAKMGKKKT